MPESSNFHPLPDTLGMLSSPGTSGFGHLQNYQSGFSEIELPCGRVSCNRFRSKVVFLTPPSQIKHWTTVASSVFDSQSEAFHILGQRDPLTDPAADEQKPPKGLRFFRQQVCFGGLAKLLGLGSGRARRLRSAALKREDCPLDGRLAKTRPHGKIGLASYKRGLIFDFLTKIYLKHSEPAPECNSASKQPEEKVLQFRRACRRGKRPRREQKKDRSEWNPDAAELRMLPPGTYKDYLRLFHSDHPDTSVSFKLFTRVPCGKLTRFLWQVDSCGLIPAGSWM